MRPNLDQVRSLSDFASLYRWNLAFARSAGGVIVPNSEALNLRCVSSALPKATGSTYPVIIRGQETINPGRWNTSGSITLTFIETVDNLVLNFIQSWRQACWTMNTGFGGTKAETLVTTTLLRLDRKDQPVRKYVFDAFLSDYDNGGDLAAEGEIINPTITLSYDRFDESDARGSAGI